MIGTSIFTTGPFKEAHEKAEEFGINLHYIQCYEATMIERERAQKEYEAALLLKDESMIAQTKEHLEYCDGILLLATEIKHAGREKELVQ